MIFIPSFVRRTPFIGKAALSLLRRYSRTVHPRWLVQKRMGAVLLMDQLNAVDRHMLYRGAWEEAQLTYLLDLAHTNKASVFLDIGSHGGLYSIYLSARHDFERVVAFEPVPDNLAQLNANLLLNNCLETIEVMDIALSNYDGQTSFVIAGNVNRGMSRIGSNRANEHERLIHVKAARIDSLIGLAGKTIVAKIDVEGGEFEVLEGMKQLLASNKVVLQIEHQGDRRGELDAMLQTFGIAYLGSISDDHFYAHP